MGATGRMGQELLAALPRLPDLKLVGAIARRGQGSLMLSAGSSIPLSSDVEEIIRLTQPQVLVDFSAVEATRRAVGVACHHGVNLVIGTSGLTPEDLTQMETLASKHKVGIVVAPNFALGAVVMIQLARQAARFFDYAEIIEMHHHLKRDAPSGTALATARAMLDTRERPFTPVPTEKENLKGSRGGEMGGISIHSLRLPGLHAHQEIILGAQGQTLTLRHDALSRECYLPGVFLAIREVVKLKGLVSGLDKLLGLNMG